MPENPSEAVARMDEARLRLNEADELLRADFYDAAARSAYYAVFHAATALLVVEGVRPKTHRGLASEIGRRYVVTGKFPSEIGGFLERVLDVRMKADYGVLTPISSEEAEETVAAAHAFPDSAVQILESD